MADSRTSTGSCRVRLIGVGSPHGDDRAGWSVAERLAELDPQKKEEALPMGRGGVSIVSVATPIDLLEYLDGVEQLQVCDAFVGDGPAGRLYRWLWPEAAIEQTRFVGSHDISLAAALQLAESLGLLPAQVVVWGIDVGPSPCCVPPASADRFSTTLETGIRAAVQQIAAELSQWARHA